MTSVACVDAVVHEVPRLPDEWLPPAGYSVASCPVCEARVMRSDAIPEGASTRCTTCALKNKLGVGRRNA